MLSKRVVTGDQEEVGKDKMYAHLQFIINATRLESCSFMRGNAEVPPTKNFVTEDVLHTSCGFNECLTI